MVPGTLFTAADFNSYQGGTGVLTNGQVETAIAQAEIMVGSWLSTGLVPTTVTEEHPYPIDDNKITLNKVRLISVGTITTLHGPDCNCVHTEVTGCAAILNARQSIIQIQSCTGAIVGCFAHCRCPQRVRITYTYGFTAAETTNTMVGESLKAAVFSVALGLIQTSIGMASQGNAAITSWSSVGYSESRQMNESGGFNELRSPLVQGAQEQLRQSGLIVKRMQMLQRRKKGTYG